MAERDAQAARLKDSGDPFSLKEFLAWTRQQAARLGVQPQVLDARIHALQEEQEREEYENRLAAIPWAELSHALSEANEAPSHLRSTVIARAALEHNLKPADLIAGVRQYRDALARRKAALEHPLQSVIESDDITYMHPILAACTLPYANPRMREWKVTHLNNVLEIEAGKIMDPGRAGVRERRDIPWGGYARLLMAHINKEAMRSNVVNMGTSMRAFMKRNGVSIGGKQGAELTENALNIGAAKITFATWEPGDEREVEIPVTTRRSFWLEKDERQYTIWQPEFTLSHEYVEMVRERSVPVLFPHLAQLRKYPLAYDLYNFANWRLPLIRGAPKRAPYASLIPIFGHSFVFDLEERDPWKAFRRALRRELKRVHALYPDAGIDVAQDHLLLHHSPTVIPRLPARRAQFPVR